MALFSTRGCLSPGSIFIMDTPHKPELRLPEKKNLLPPLSRSPVHPSKESTINSLIQKCNEIQSNVYQTYELLKNKPKKGLGESQSHEFLFSKTPNFKKEKARLKEAVRNYVEQKYSDKLHRVKSVIRPSEPGERELLSPDDIQNKDAARFLSLNKRNFGNTSDIAEVKYEQPYKSKKKVTKINPVETVLNNIKSIMNARKGEDLEKLISEYRRATGLLSMVNEGSPRSRLVEHELIKLWPSTDEANQSKKKLFKHKIEKLVALNREATNYLKQPHFGQKTRRKKENFGFASS